MGKKKKKPKGPKGAAAYKAELESRGLTSVMTDVKKSVSARTKRTSTRVRSPLSERRAA